MTLLTKQQILAVDDLKTEDVDMPEWGGIVRIRELTAEQRLEWNDRAFKSGVVDMREFRHGVLALSIVGDDGNPVFTQDDLAALGAKSVSAIDKLFARVDALNVLTPKAQQEAEKNSAAGGTGETSLPSPGA